MVDLLEPAAVEPLLSGRFGHPYLYIPSCASTQELLSEDAPEGAVAATDLQTAGRGRYGRTWVAPAGTSLLCSIALRPPGERRLAELTLVGAVAVAHAVEEAASASAEIKWPNDVLLDARKVAGILGELRDGLVVLGFGINVKQRPAELPPATRTPATSLRVVSGRGQSRAALLASLLLHLEQAYEGWQANGLAAVHEDLVARDALRDRTVEVEGRRGVASGIDGAGRLLLDVGDGEIVAVESGEVRLG